MNRTTLSLIAGTTALVAVTGLAALTAPDGSADDAGGSAQRRPVERSSLLCPSPGPSDLAETTYTSFTPGSTGGTAKGSAELLPAADPSESGGGADDSSGGKDAGKDGSGDKTADGKGKGRSREKSTDGDKGGAAAGKPVLSGTQPGKPSSADASGADRPALLGSADGAMAPGWTVQQTTQVAAGDGRGLYGVACSAPDTDFWFPGASTADDRTDYVHLTNPDDSAAVADIELYGKGGAIKSDVGEGIQVGPHQSVRVLLSTLTDRPETNLTVHVGVRSGRVAAAMRVADAEAGGDWLPAAGSPERSLVMPGIPKDATAVRLVAFAPGDDDADLNVKLSSPTGSITPAGHETLHVKSGMTAAVDLGPVTRGEAGSLLLTPSDAEGRPVPVVAALRVVRGQGAHQESAFIPATAPVGERATAAGNHAKGTTLSLTAPDGPVQVRITSSAGTGGGSAVSRTYSVKARTTLAVQPPVPQGLKGTYAVTVEPVSGGPLYAARTLELPEDGIPMFTVQPLADDHGMVQVPKAEQDLSILQK
ncbi:hypothetical protein GCM10018793_33290 [Streptomyces sulfonofaciens]|uniref:Secreted protein n=1 Tax=Streptomyces sulfonofaciens TaxID=68272 RepID=A0A919L1B4_9ACTN|nr:DUF5719 family protein [Streptomyces sulfonofaciens]GHH79794.1 hypothetical protein GCM10018793_33290 [Streptomyces sulfonofaciens]